MFFTCIQLRRSPASDWQAANPVLADGEVGLETDTGGLKIGNGVSRWCDLGYALEEVFSAEEKAKLATIQAGATAAGAVGDEHAKRTDNPHGITAAQVGAEPLGSAQAAVTAHQAVAAQVHFADQIADTSGRVIMTAAERSKLGALPAAAAPASHVGAGGTAAHPLAVASNAAAGGAAGFLSAADKEKLNGIGVGAQPNPAQVTAAERTAGAETTPRSYSPADIRTMVQTHGAAVPNADGLADGTAKVIMTAAERTRLADLDSATRAHLGAGGVVQHPLVVASIGGVGGSAGFMDPRDKENLDKLGPGNYGAGARNTGEGTGLFSGRRTAADDNRGLLEFRSLQGRQAIATSLSADGQTAYIDYTGPATSTAALLTAIDAALGNTTWRTGGGSTGSGLPAAPQTITESYTPVLSSTVFLGGAGGLLRLPPAQSGIHAVDLINDGTGPWSVQTSGIVEGMSVAANTALPNTDTDKNPFVLSFDPHGLPSSPQLTLAWVMYPTATATNWQLLGTSSSTGNTSGGANLVDIGTCIIGGAANSGIIVRVQDAGGNTQVDARWPYARNQLSVCYLTMNLAEPTAELWINGTLVPMSVESTQWPPRTPRSTPTAAANEPVFAFAATGRNRLWFGGGQSGSRFELDGALGRLWLATGLYLPGAANAAKFCAPNSPAPLYLGGNGQVPTGTPPAYYLNGDARDFARNYGSIGNTGVFSTDVAARISSAAAAFPFIEKMSWGTAPMVVPAGGSIALRRKATAPVSTWVEAR
ncbi:MAG: hypothetical protein JNM48_06500 [Rhodospirillales bacterium]|nr:hypothetical protein [Rhodospirillales bacterium]